MYTPKVRKTVRIPVGMMHEPVMGSDFTYDDVIKAATLTDDYDPKIIGLSKEMSKEHRSKVFILDLTPIEGRPIAYKKLRLWIREKGSILLRQQFYDESLNVTRVLQYTQIKKMGGKAIPTHHEMFDLTKEGHSSVIHYRRVLFDSLSDEDLFAQRSLTNPPTPDWQGVEEGGVDEEVANDDDDDDNTNAKLPDAKELVVKADLLLRGEKSSNEYFDFIVKRPGNVISRKAVSYLMGKPFSFVHFLTPISDRDTTILKRDYDLWVYTPKVRKNVRIPVGMMHESIMGSDFTYDDLVKASTLADDYDPKIVGISKELSKEHKSKVYVLDLTPLEGRPIAYKKLRLWIREKGNVILRQQYYDENLNVTRVQQYSDIKEIGGREIPAVREMFDMTKEGHSTEINIMQGAYNTLSDEDLFAQRSLTNPPKPTWDEK
jgi:outer membrane lipoprotein-sorting protein